MIEKPEQAEAVTLTRRQWVRVAAALAIRTYTDPRLQDLATIFGKQVAAWEPRGEDVQRTRRDPEPYVGRSGRRYAAEDATWEAVIEDGPLEFAPRAEYAHRGKR